MDHFTQNLSTIKTIIMATLPASAVLQRVAPTPWLKPNAAQTWLDIGDKFYLTWLTEHTHRKTRGACAFFHLNAPLYCCGVAESPKKRWNWSIDNFVKQLSHPKMCSRACRFKQIMQYHTSVYFVLRFSFSYQNFELILWRNQSIYCSKLQNNNNNVFSKAI